MLGSLVTSEGPEQISSVIVVTESDDLVIPNREDHHPFVFIGTPNFTYFAFVLSFDHYTIILGGDFWQLKTLRLYVLTEFFEELPLLALCSESMTRESLANGCELREAASRPIPLRIL